MATTAQRKRILGLWLAAALLGCGGDDATRVILFDGSPGDLLPHQLGHVSRFEANVLDQEGQVQATTILENRILSEGPYGSFLLETLVDDRPSRRIRARATGDRILIEATAEHHDGTFVWSELVEPVILVRTPVLEGATRSGRFVRTLEVVVRIDGREELHSLRFSGTSTSTARGWEKIEVGSQALEALRFDRQGSGTIESRPGLPPHLSDLRFSFEGAEHRVVGVGLVREVLALRIGLRGEETRLRLQTERRFDEAPALAHRTRAAGRRAGA